MSSELEKLRDEIIGFEAIIAEFQKWKLIGIGSVFAAGLGFATTEQGGGSGILALFAIPIVTIYADLLTRDYFIRIVLIGRFMSFGTGIFGDHERFLSQQRAWGLQWVFGPSASVLSSVAANGAVWLLGCHLGFLGSKQAAVTDQIRSILVNSSISGIVLVLLIQVIYHLVVRRILRSPDPTASPQSDSK